MLDTDPGLRCACPGLLSLLPPGENAPTVSYTDPAQKKLNRAILSAFFAERVGDHDAYLLGRIRKRRFDTASASFPQPVNFLISSSLAASRHTVSTPQTKVRLRGPRYPPHGQRRPRGPRYPPHGQRRPRGPRYAPLLTPRSEKKLAPSAAAGKLITGSRKRQTEKSR